MSVIEDALKQAETEAATPRSSLKDEAPVRDDGRPHSLDDHVSYPESPREGARSADAASGRTALEMTAMGIVVGAVATVAIIAMIGTQWSTAPIAPSPAAATNSTGLANPAGPNPAGTLLESTASSAAEYAPTREVGGQRTAIGNVGDRSVGGTSPQPALANPTSAGGASRFRLTGVMLGGNRAVAIVNGAMVRVGQSIDGAEVLSIQSTTVRLRKDGRDFELLLDLARGR